MPHLLGAIGTRWGGRPPRRMVMSQRDQSPNRAGTGRCHGGSMTVMTASTIPASEDARYASPDFSVRSIASTDAAALVRFHAHLSRRSIQLRYFFPHLELQPAEVAHLTCVDGFDRVAYVVEHDGEIVAVGRYDRLADHCSAEVALVVADESQHHGLGTMLLERLVDTARRPGIGEFKASVLAENSTMLAVFHGSGYPMTQIRTYDVHGGRGQGADGLPGHHAPRLASRGLRLQPDCRHCPVVCDRSLLPRRRHGSAGRPRLRPRPADGRDRGASPAHTPQGTLVTA